jgi:hypothetical protein
MVFTKQDKKFGILSLLRGPLTYKILNTLATSRETVPVGRLSEISVGSFNKTGELQLRTKCVRRMGRDPNTAGHSKDHAHLLLLGP